MKAQAGTARRCITPFWGVELTGWGYDLKRTWQKVHDPIFATALVLENEMERIALISLDLMIISEEFTRVVRDMVQQATGIPAKGILVCCTHTHNAPASGGLLGVGEVDPIYEAWAARQAATVSIEAWNARQPATCSAASAIVDHLTFNRTREGGVIDPTLTVLQIDNLHGAPLSVVIGFQAHPTVATVLRPRSVSRDVPGEVCDLIEAALPGCLALYIQGACGDVNFHRSFSTEEKSSEPAEQLAAAALSALQNRRALDMSRLGAAVRTVRIPTRRWTREEIDADRAEAERRLRQHDLHGWRESIGRSMTNRPEDMVARHGGDEWKAVEAMCRFNLQWTERMLQDLDTRPLEIETEIQALLLGDLGIVSNASEFFSPFALDLRQRVHVQHLMVACYANGRIGYLPDVYDIERRSYAAYQSPKYCNQFPFTAESGPVMVNAMAELINGIH